MSIHFQCLGWYLQLRVVEMVDGLAEIAVGEPVQILYIGE